MRDLFAVGAENVKFRLQTHRSITVPRCKNIPNFTFRGLLDLDSVIPLVWAFLGVPELTTTARGFKRSPLHSSRGLFEF